LRYGREKLRGMGGKSKRNIHLMEFAVRYDLVEHLKRLPIQYFAGKDSEYINQRVSSDSANVASFILNNVVTLLTTFFTLLFAIIIMFYLNFAIALMICFLFPVYLLIYFKFRQPLYRMGYKLAEESNEFHGRANRQLTNINLIKQNAWSDHAGNELKVGFLSLFQTIMKNARISYIFNNTDTLIKYLANIIIFVYSGFQIIAGYMSIGQFTMINLYSLMVISSLSVFLNFGKNYRNSLVAYDRIMEIQNTKQEQSGEIRIDSIENITINNLAFSYDNRSIISSFNAEMKKGQVCTIVGENGSGKSTFLNILTGMNQGYTGDVYFNSTNLREINNYHLREKCLAIVEQEPTLYFDTLIENISLEVDKRQSIDYWINKLDLGDLVASLPNGLDYNIYEKAANLSGGEKQRLAEVRAFVKDTDVLIMDEPNSALDKASLKLLCRILQEIKHNKIVVLVTHEQSLIDISDVVIKFGIV